jgi:hypothetical protein
MDGGEEGLRKATILLYAAAVAIVLSSVVLGFIYG